jgi:uncharacterized membrane protein YhaH (DUF805 family)
MPPTAVRASRARSELVANLMAVPAAIALAMIIYDYVTRSSGIAGTAGAALVIAGTAALTVASLIVGRLHDGALRTTLTVLILIGAVLTLVAAWFLQSGVVMTAMVVMLLAWLIFIFVAR